MGKCHVAAECWGSFTSTACMGQMGSGDPAGQLLNHLGAECFLSKAMGVLCNLWVLFLLTSGGRWARS